MAKKLTKRQKNKLNKAAMKHWRVVVAILVILVMFVTIAYFMGWLDKWFKKDPILSTAGGYSTTVNELKDIEVNFLDIGQGDCIIIELPDGKNMIIDSGEHNSCQDVIKDFTDENNIDTFDYLLLTHQDSDHAGNMNWVIDNYQVNYIFRPNNYSSHKNSADLPADFNTSTSGAYVSSTKTYSEFMVSAYNEKCTVEVFNKDSDFSNELVYNDNKYSYSFNFWTPTADRDKIDYSGPNDYSPIMTLHYGDNVIMFTGDAELENLEEYVSTYGSENNIDVLKVGHHGSENATTLDFIKAIDPEFAVIQCGLDNSYGHPHAETLVILKNHEGGICVYRNDTNGTITLNVSISEKISSSSFSMEKTDCSGNFVPGVKPSEKSLDFRYDEYLANKKLLVA